MTGRRRASSSLARRFPLRNRIDLTESSGFVTDHLVMALELTIDQARRIARLRRRWPDAEVRAHQRPWGVIVEVTAGGRTLAITALDGTGGIEDEQPLAWAA